MKHVARPLPGSVVDGVARVRVELPDKGIGRRARHVGDRYLPRTETAIGAFGAKCFRASDHSWRRGQRREVNVVAGVVVVGTEVDVPGGGAVFPVVTSGAFAGSHVGSDTAHSPGPGAMQPSLP